MSSTAPAGAFEDFYRCPAALAPAVSEQRGTSEGYFAFDSAIGYGRIAGAAPATYVTDQLPETGRIVSGSEGRLVLPFDLTEVVANFHYERYRPNAPRYLDTVAGSSVPRRLYYFMRPALSVSVRRHLQRFRFNGWRGLSFPRWPVDVTVPTLVRAVMKRVVEQSPEGRVPFIWFWPEGASSCALVTHDVEGVPGEAFCDALMDIDESYGIKSAFQIVPETASRSTDALRQRIRQRGFEVNLHDFNHDGHLFSNREEFLRRAAEINRYAREFGCKGFRSGAMYREQSWLHALDVEYDMSVPNVAHLEPQRGGCCTVMPHFLGNLLELPLTTTQDYSLFHILRDYSVDLWKQQSELIMAEHGLISMIAHPDYLVGKPEQKVYREMLAYLSGLRERHNVWVTLPGEVNRWWRSRHRMRLVEADGAWRIEGPDSARARLAWATVENGRLTYSLDRR